MATPLLQLMGSDGIALLVQGVDFFFSKRSHAQRFLDFLQGVVPIRYRSDKQLVSHNEQNASYNYKYTFSVEIVPICKVCTVIVSGNDYIFKELDVAQMYVGNNAVSGP